MRTLATPPDENVVTLSRSRILLAILVATLAAALSACGRHGPVELPPETRARGAALKAQQEAAQARTQRGAKPPAPGADAPSPPPPPIPGTVGNRPPDQYPFLLDPLL